MGVLDDHGTVLHTLKPTSLVEAARADLRKAARKRAGELEPTDPYAFHRVHVRAASDVADLISRALDDRDRGRASGKRITRLIYGCQPLLAAALVAATGGGMSHLSPSNEGAKSDVTLPAGAAA